MRRKCFNNSNFEERFSFFHAQVSSKIIYCPVSYGRHDTVNLIKHWTYSAVLMKALVWLLHQFHSRRYEFKLAIMSSWAISALNVLITALDLIMFPMTFLTTMHHPWRRHVKRPKHYQPPEFVLDPDSGELVLNPEHPEATCANKEIMDKEGLDTMDKVFNFMTKKYLNKPCLGTRKVLGTTKRLTEEEKILKKVIFEDKYEITNFRCIRCKYFIIRYYWLTYKEVSEQVNSIAAGLQSIGVKSGDKVLIFADTCPEWMILALACFKFAVTVVTLYSNLGDEGVVSGINQVNVQVVVTK